jgi:hypothetical protein
MVGATVGKRETVGWMDMLGRRVGVLEMEGLIVGTREGARVGNLEMVGRAEDGRMVGLAEDGRTVGLAEEGSNVEGIKDGGSVGMNVGNLVGLLEGMNVGSLEGRLVGLSVGYSVG